MASKGEEILRTHFKNFYSLPSLVRDKLYENLTIEDKLALGVLDKESATKSSEFRTTAKQLYDYLSLILQEKADTFLFTVLKTAHYNDSWIDKESKQYFFKYDIQRLRLDLFRPETSHRDPEKRQEFFNKTEQIIKSLEDFWEAGRQSISNKVLEKFLSAAGLPIPDIHLLSYNDIYDVFARFLKNYRWVAKERKLMFSGLMYLLIELHKDGEVEEDMIQSFLEEIDMSFESLHDLFRSPAAPYGDPSQ